LDQRYFGACVVVGGGFEALMGLGRTVMTAIAIDANQQSDMGKQIPF